MEDYSLLRAAIFWGSLPIFWFSYGNFLIALIIAVVLYAFCGGWKLMKIIIETTPRDTKALYCFLQMKQFMRQFKTKHGTIGSRFQEIARKYPQKICVYFEDKTWTFEEVEEYSNRIANGFSELGFRPGDEVAIYMISRPEYFFIWLGLSKIGVIPALVNNNIRSESLVHSFTAIKCKAIIFGSDLQIAIKDVMPILKEKIVLQYFCLGDFDDFGVPIKSLNLLIHEASPLPPSTKYKGSFNDRLFYIYTSGTTGLPKAAIIKHSRFTWSGAGFYYFKKIRHDDVLYCSLPLYHAAGNMIACSQTVLFGCSLVLRSKFSASKFWDDCIKYKCTIANYIGETCRYLLVQPERPVEKQHSIRLMFGNGLRPQIWRQFMKRFNVNDIGEFYGATEGNANMMNIDNKVGAVGFLPIVFQFLYPVMLIKVDKDTSKPCRDEKGLCIRCKPGEPGELVGKIINSDPLHSFDGYVNQSANKKKIVRNVFSHGDMAFLSGDVLVMDEHGYFYFMDRTGDTFRWRGENVSTSEVEGTISKIVVNKDCIVYGVSVPGAEGRAGMAAICDPDHDLNLEYLLKEMKRILPTYAVPLFIRLVDKLEVTGTFKLKKTDLKSEEFNVFKIKDPLYFLDASKDRYVPLDQNIYNDICEGKKRL